MHTFDCSAVAPPAAEAAADGDNPDASRPLRVMVVEDQALIALSLAADLASMGCDVVGRAATAEAAIELARRVNPDIVLMDVHLGGRMDGIEAAARIAEHAGPRIVFLTAYADGPERKRMEALHPAAILGKPYEPDDLARLVVPNGGGARPRRHERLASAA